MEAREFSIMSLKVDKSIHQKFKSAPVVREYVKMTEGDLFNELWHYDNDEVKQTYKVKQTDENHAIVSVRGSLHQRTWSQEIDVSVTVGKNNDFVWGVALGTVVVAGGIVWMLTR